MSYLERWWRDASHSEKEAFIKLVKNGQLEIVGGGWVMNDEVFYANKYVVYIILIVSILFKASSISILGQKC